MAEHEDVTLNTLRNGLGDTNNFFSAMVVDNELDKKRVMAINANAPKINLSAIGH